MIRPPAGLAVHEAVRSGRGEPGAGDVIRRFGLDVSRTPSVTGTTGWDEIGYHPSRHFGTFVAEARSLTDAEAAAR